MKSVEVIIHCELCKQFRVEYMLDTNEHGFFSVPDAYCPVCFCMLTQDLHGECIRDITNAY